RVVKFGAVLFVVEVAAERTEDRHFGRRAVAGPERGHRCRVRDRIETDHQKESMGPDNDVRWKIKIDRVSQMPRVRGVTRIEQRRRVVGDVQQLDILADGVIEQVDADLHVRGMVHDLVDDNGADLWPGIARPESGGALRDELFLARAVNVTPKGHSAFRCAKSKAVDVTLTAR